MSQKVVFFPVLLSLALAYKPTMQNSRTNFTVVCIPSFWFSHTHIYSLHRNRLSVRRLIFSKSWAVTLKWSGPCIRPISKSWSVNSANGSETLHPFCIWDARYTHNTAQTPADTPHINNLFHNWRESTFKINTYKPLKYAKTDYREG